MRSHFMNRCQKKKGRFLLDVSTLEFLLFAQVAGNSQHDVRTSCCTRDIHRLLNTITNSQERNGLRNAHLTYSV